jgi:hypothetical protein
MTFKPNSSGDNSKRDPSDSAETRRSRLEIESELTGSVPIQKKRARRTTSDAIDLNTPPRRQKVIGGNLTGVSKRPKFGILSRYHDISIMNWVALAIALLILTAFFWPQENNSTQEVNGAGQTPAPQIGETDLSEYEQREFLADQAKNEGLSFGRDDDIQRASVYRKQEARDLKIRTLLKKAQTEIEKDDLTLPKNHNAADTYKAVLLISANNVEAIQGLDFISNKFLSRGYEALELNNAALAEGALNKLIEINHGPDEISELQLAIETWKAERRLRALLVNARSAYAKRLLILPVESNALYFYRQALLIDESNQTAIDGVQRIADSYIQLANDSVLNGQFETAESHLAVVRSIDQNHSSIALVRAMIERARPLFEAELEVSEEQVEEELILNSASLANDNLSTSDSSSDKPLDNGARTPRRQTTEQETFDRQYLKQGLESYYKGEYEVAAALLQPLADKGIARAQFKLAYMHFLGRGFRADRAIADKMILSTLPAIEKFADDGRAWAQADLGNLYEDGLVLPRSYANAVYWYRSAAEQGYSEAQTNLGIMYARGRGVEANRRTAIGWFQLAAKQGDAIAQQNLETMGVIQ